MTDTMTSDQLSDLRFDLADVGSAFTDDELNRLWVRASSAASNAARFEATKGLAIRALLHDAAKFNDYTAGETAEKRSQVFDHYSKLYDSQYKAAVEKALGRGRQMVTGVWQEVPHQTRTEPSS